MVMYIEKKKIFLKILMVYNTGVTNFRRTWFST